MTFGRVIHELRDLPYITSVPRDGRLVPVQPFSDVDAGEWHLYAPYKDNSLIRLAGGESISGSYLGREPADTQRDLELPLGTLVALHLSYSGTMTALGNLESDLHRCAAILHKYHLIWDNRHKSDRAAGLLVESELEYLLLLLRSLYDVLQSLIRDLCRRFRQVADPSRKAMDDLPSSFADVVMKGDSILEVTSIATRFRMPEPLAAWYHSEAAFFRELRDLRDAIAHHGQRPSTVFETDWGFAVDPDAALWARFSPWLTGPRWEGRLASLRGVFNGFIHHALGATGRFARVLPAMLVLPEAIAGDLHVFLRSPFGHHLTRLAIVREQPWEGRESPEVT